MEVNDSNSLSHMQLADRTSSIARGAFSSSPLNLFATTGLASGFLGAKTAQKSKLIFVQFI